MLSNMKYAEYDPLCEFQLHALDSLVYFLNLGTKTSLVRLDRYYLNIVFKAKMMMSYWLIQNLLSMIDYSGWFDSDQQKNRFNYQEIKGNDILLQCL